LNFWILIKLFEITTYYLFNKYLYFELMIHKNDAVIAHLFNSMAIHIRCFHKRYSFRWTKYLDFAGVNKRRFLIYFVTLMILTMIAVFLDSEVDFQFL